MAALLAYLFLALFVSFLCSIMESVLLSTPHSFLIVKQKKGNLWAKKYADFKVNIDKPLSAILSLNTVAHTIGAAGVGARAVAVFGEAYFGIVSAILTLLILISTEIIPKTIGAVHWRKLAKMSYFIMKGMIFLTYPLVVMSAFITRLISINKKIQTTSREEIAALAGIGKKEGLFTEKENKIIQSILRLKNVKATEVMTPRVVVTVADENLTIEDFLKNRDFLTFSRIPLFSEEKDLIEGYVFKHDLIEKISENRQDLKLKEIKREIFIVPDTVYLLTLWERLLEKKEHIALIIDEHGGFKGIVTMEDIIETLLGFEILDEKDTIIDMQKYARDRWKYKKSNYPDSVFLR